MDSKNLFWIWIKGTFWVDRFPKPTSDLTTLESPWAEPRNWQWRPPLAGCDLQVGQHSLLSQTLSTLELLQVLTGAGTGTGTHLFRLVDSSSDAEKGGPVFKNLFWSLCVMAGIVTLIAAEAVNVNKD